MFYLYRYLVTLERQKYLPQPAIMKAVCIAPVLKKRTNFSQSHFYKVYFFIYSLYLFTYYGALAVRPFSELLQF